MEFSCDNKIYVELKLFFFVKFLSSFTYWNTCITYILCSIYALTVKLKSFRHVYIDTYGIVLVLEI